jgi:hypothetical protein
MDEESELRSHPVDYELDDIVALSKQVPRSPASMARILIVSIVILLMVPIIVQVWWLTGMFDWLSLGIFLILPLAVLLLSNRRVRARLRLMAIRQSPLHAAQSYEITPAALRISSSKGVFDLRWTAFANLKRSADRLFAFVNHPNAYVVPRRAFDSDEQFDAFATAALERWEQSQRL